MRIKPLIFFKRAFLALNAKEKRGLYRQSPGANVPFSRASRIAFSIGDAGLQGPETPFWAKIVFWSGQAPFLEFQLHPPFQLPNPPSIPPQLHCSSHASTQIYIQLTFQLQFQFHLQPVDVDLLYEASTPVKGDTSSSQGYRSMGMEQGVLNHGY